MALEGSAGALLLVLQPETFRTPTWTDYLRLNHRLTTAGRNWNERVLLVHKGEFPPQATLLIERPTSPARKTEPWTPFSPLDQV
ncbi:hypothetical protein X729_31960 [Mesorhizobium sp. L103C131B0]|nr:hypothetical protein X729_31960 [Mesorhizobium sp. L103C131B0]